MAVLVLFACFSLMCSSFLVFIPLTQFRFFENGFFRFSPFYLKSIQIIYLQSMPAWNGNFFVVGVLVAFPDKKNAWISVGFDVFVRFEAKSIFVAFPFVPHWHVLMYRRKKKSNINKGTAFDCYLHKRKKHARTKESICSSSEKISFVWKSAVFVVVFFTPSQDFLAKTEYL